MAVQVQDAPFVAADQSLCPCGVAPGKDGEPGPLLDQAVVGRGENGRSQIDESVQETAVRQVQRAHRLAEPTHELAP